MCIGFIITKCPLLFLQNPLQSTIKYDCIYCSYANIKLILFPLKIPFPPLENCQVDEHILKSEHL